MIGFVLNFVLSSIFTFTKLFHIGAFVYFAVVVCQWDCFWTIVTAFCAQNTFVVVNHWAANKNMKL